MFEQYPCNPNNELRYYQSLQRYVKTVCFLVSLRESGGFPPFLIMLINLPLTTDAEEIGDYCRHKLSMLISENAQWHSLNKSGQKWFSLFMSLSTRESPLFILLWATMQYKVVLPTNGSIITSYINHMGGKTVFAILATSYIMCTFPPEHVLIFCP